MIGTTIGPYRLVAGLGSGGMGEVWLAEGPAGRVALKLLHWHHVGNPDFVQRFLREGEIGRRIRHPNVSSVLDVGLAQLAGRDVPFVALEYVAGRSLRALLDENGAIPEPVCRGAGLEIAHALAAIHGAGAVHRDVKPENVLVAEDRLLKLTDLGVACDARDAGRLTNLGTWVGTVAYAAPEQYRTRDLDGRADLYALGSVLFEMAAGRPPFPGDDAGDVLQRKLAAEPPRLAAGANVSPFFDEVVATLLRRERADRFPSARELIAVLTTGESSVWWKNRVRAQP